MDINWIAVVVAALLPTLIGYIWYVPLFGKQWQSSMGFSDEDLKTGNMAVIYGVSFLMALILAIGITTTIPMLHGAEGSFHTFKHGALHGAMIGVFFAVPVLVSNSLFQKNKGKTILINVGYWIFTMAMMGGVVDVWQ